MDEGDSERFFSFLRVDVVVANTPQEFLMMCGVAGLGKLLAQGELKNPSLLRQYARHQSWRIREAVCMALQHWGETDMDALLSVMRQWADGHLLERRALIAGLCEPALLTNPVQVILVLNLLDRVTASLLVEENRRSDDFRILCKGLSYCWSVAVAALPETGKQMMEKWLICPDKVVEKIMRENLKRNRLKRLDADWVHLWQDRR